MEFNQKIQELRKAKGLTQEELAEGLYVSRTAVSKWESGRGYPNIESLKAIAKFFSVTVDELLSTDEILVIAEEDSKRREGHFFDIAYGALDLCAVLLIFLPFFAERAGEMVKSVSLMELDGVQPYLKAVYVAAIIAMSAVGLLTFALQSCQAAMWLKIKLRVSLVLGIALVFLFVISSQPYAAVFAIALLLVKALILIKRR